MIILRQKKYSWFNSYDLYDFFDDIDKSNYQNKSKDLKTVSADWDSTYQHFNKGGINKNEIKNKLNNLDSNVSSILKRNNIPGTTKDWQLYSIRLVGSNKIEVGLENTKSGEAFSCEI